MSKKKTLYTVFDRGTGLDVNGTLTTASFTSQAIEVVGSFWNLNVYFDAPVTGFPRVTIQGSNTDGVDSFNDLDSCLVNCKVPQMLESLTATYKYMRIVYDDNGATGGNKYFDLTFSNPTE